MTEDKFVVYFEGEPKFLLNAKLVEKQGIGADGLEIIKNLHVERLSTENLMLTAQGSNLKSLVKIWSQLQFDLQKSWGFPLDERFHAFWSCPRCECPKLDNWDAHPSGYYVTNLSCPLHGEGK